MPLPLRYADAEVAHAYDDDREKLTRFGPDLLGDAKTSILNSHSTFLAAATFSSKNIPSISFVDSTRRHATADSITTTSSLTCSDSDPDTAAEAIELSALRSLPRTVRTRSFVGTGPSHERFESSASASTAASSSSSPSECECACEGEIRLTSAARLNLDRKSDENLPAHDSARIHGEDEDKADSVLDLEDRASDQSTPPLTPMSPRQTRYAHRIYVPSNSHHDNDHIYGEEVAEVDLDSHPLCMPARHSLDSAHLAPAETDSLLPVRFGTSQVSLPLPTTAAYRGEPTLFRFSFSFLETGFHVIGITITIFLVIFSIWLTLANVTM